MKKLIPVAAALLAIAGTSTVIGQSEPSSGSPPTMASAYASSLGIDVAEAERRLQLLEEAQQVSGKLKAKIGNRWGGVRLISDASTFRVEFLITGNAEKELDGFTTRPEFVPVQVSRSYQALKNKFDRLLAALEAEGIDYEVALLPADNVVEVRHLPNAAARDVLKKFKSLINDEVRVVETPDLAEASAMIMGGNGLTWTFNDSTGASYAGTGTTGWVVNDLAKGGQGVTTAGHVTECASRAASSCAAAYTIASTCKPNGVVRDTRHAVDLTWDRQSYAPSQDVELRKASASHTFTNKMTSQGYDYTIASKFDPRSRPENTIVYCKEGATTKYTCGTVVAHNAAFSGGKGGVFVKGVANNATTGIAQGGDSGGPVFVGVTNQPTQVAAIGVTVGNGGSYVTACGARMEHFFMSIVDVESALNVSLKTQ